MNRRHHAARAAAGQFDRGKCQRKKPGVPFDLVPLLLSSAPPAARVERTSSFSAVIVQFERVAGEVRDLIAIERNHLLAACFQSATNFFPSVRIGDQLQSDQGKFRTDTHASHSCDRSDGHHRRRSRKASVRNRNLCKIFATQFAVRPFGKRDVCDPIHVIEDETSRAFEIKAALFVGRVIDHRADSINLAQLVDHIPSSLVPARGRIHRIKRNSAVVMRREPVVWKNRVRLLRRRRCRQKREPSRRHRAMISTA